MRLLAVSDTRLYVVDVSVAAWRGCSALPCCDMERVVLSSVMYVRTSTISFHHDPFLNGFST